jgi:hypothetical protein
MANPIPPLMIVNYKGSGNVAVYKLLNGITLDPVQDGSDVLAGNLEVPNALHMDNHANRLIEAFGKRYLLHGERVYERDQGGDGNWGSIFSTENISSSDHSGLHLLHPNGVPTLCFLDWTQGSAVRKHTSTNGTSFVTDPNIGTINGFVDFIGTSTVFQNSIAWLIQGNDGGLLVHDLVLDSSIKPTLTGPTGSDTSSSDLLVHKNKLFIAYFHNTTMTVDRLDGSSLTNVFSSGHFNSNGSGVVMFSDGDEIILFFDQFSAGANKAFAITDPTGSPGSVDISSVLGGISHTSPHGWNRYISLDPDPSQPTVYLWHNAGDLNTGTFDLYRYRYRQIGHDAPTGSFTIGETVSQAVSGATGRVMESSGTTLDLTDVTGTFNASDTITGADSGATASANSPLAYQTLVSLGSGVSKANFGLPSIADGGLNRVPVKGAARPGWDGQPVEVLGGRTKWFFRLHGSGPAVNLEMFFSPVEEAPDRSSTLVNGTLVVESGSPATTPTITNGQTIDNVTPDGGVALYSFQHAATTDGIGEGQGYTALLDIA